MATHTTNMEPITLYDGWDFEDSIVAVKTENGYKVYAESGKRKKELFQCEEIECVWPPCYLVKIGGTWYIYDLDRIWEEMPFTEYRAFHKYIPNTFLFKDGSEWRMVLVHPALEEIRVSKYKFAYFEPVFPVDEDGTSLVDDWGEQPWFLVANEPAPKKFGVYCVGWLRHHEDYYADLIGQCIYDYVAVDFNRWKLLCYSNEKNVTDVFDMTEGIKMNSRVLEIYSEETGELLLRKYHNGLADLV